MATMCSHYHQHCCPGQWSHPLHIAQHPGRYTCRELPGTAERVQILTAATSDQAGIDLSSSRGHCGLEFSMIEVVGPSVVPALIVLAVELHQNGLKIDLILPQFTKEATPHRFKIVPLFSARPGCNFRMAGLEVDVPDCDRRGVLCLPGRRHHRKRNARCRSRGRGAQAR